LPSVRSRTRARGSPRHGWTGAAGVGVRCSCAAGPPCLSFKDLETIDFTSQSRRFTTLRAAAFLINGIAILVAIGFLADGIPPLAHELENKRDAQANVAIEAFLAPLTLDEKARLYRVLSSTEPSFASLQGYDANDRAVLEKFRVFWQSFQNYRTQVQLWEHALRSVSSNTKAGEVWVALVLLAVVAMSALALRAHVREA
jgi:hypothetical protein